MMIHDNKSKNGKKIIRSCDNCGRNNLYEDYDMYKIKNSKNKEYYCEECALDEVFSINELSRKVKKDGYYILYDTCFKCDVGYSDRIMGCIKDNKFYCMECMRKKYLRKVKMYRKNKKEDE